MGAEFGGWVQQDASGKRIGLDAKLIPSILQILIILSKKRDGVSGICRMGGIAWRGGGRGVAWHGGRGGTG